MTSFALKKEKSWFKNQMSCIKEGTSTEMVAGNENKLEVFQTSVLSVP